MTPQHEMPTFRVSDATALKLIQSEPDIHTFVNDRSAATADAPFNERRAVVHRIADLLDAEISRRAEKYEDFDLIVDSIGKCLVVGTALWHPMFLCREYILAAVHAIADAHAKTSCIVTNHFEFYGDATDWGFAFSELKFDFAITSDAIAVSGITLGEFVGLVDRTGVFSG